MFARWDDILGIREVPETARGQCPGGGLPYAITIYHYARTLALAAKTEGALQKGKKSERQKLQVLAETSMALLRVHSPLTSLLPMDTSQHLLSPFYRPVLMDEGLPRASSLAACAGGCRGGAARGGDSAGGAARNLWLRLPDPGPHLGPACGGAHGPAAQGAAGERPPCSLTLTCYPVLT